MILASNDSLCYAPDAVFRVWCHRERIELEAAALFTRMANGLARIYGNADEIAALSREAGADELRHADRCRQILTYAPRVYPRAVPFSDSELGPLTLSPVDQVLYACVAVGCVTETLSTALLVQMHKVAAPGLIRDTVHEILSDEVNHSRIGWAELARAAQTRDISWLGDLVPAMIRAALSGDVDPMLSSAEGKQDLSEFGILPPVQAQNLMRLTIANIVLPGLAKYGVISKSKL